MTGYQILQHETDSSRHTSAALDVPCVSLLLLLRATGRPADANTPLVGSRKNGATESVPMYGLTVTFRTLVAGASQLAKEQTENCC